MAKPEDPQDPGPVPGEKKRTACPAVSLEGELAVLVKEVAAATGLGQRALIDKIEESEEFKAAVRQVVSRAVDDHVREIQVRIGFKIGGPPKPPAPQPTES